MPIGQLRDWAGVADGSSDDTLLLIESGVIKLIASGSNRLLFSPPQIYEETLEATGLVGGGLSGIDASTQQRVRLLEEPQPKLTGTVTVAPGGIVVTGTSTKFLSQLAVGAPITVAAESILVESIESDVSLTLAEPHVAGATDAKATGGLITIEARQTPAGEWTAEDPRLFEVQGRVIWTTSQVLPAGRRLVRIRYLLGWEEGEQPEDIGLLILEMVRSAFRNKNQRAESVSVDGAFSLTWADFGEEAKVFMEQARAIRRPVGFGA